MNFPMSGSGGGRIREGSGIVDRERSRAASGVSDGSR